MLDIDGLVADAKAAISETEPRRAVRELVERAMRTPTEVGDALQPTRGGLDLLYQSDDLTVLHVVWAPRMRLFPHDHQMWAVIGIYAGQEDNTFYRRTGDDRSTIDQTSGKDLHVGDVPSLGPDAIHAVSNPLDRVTAAIHVYGGDFVNHPRSQWGPGPLEERPFDLDQVRTEFAEANTAAGLTQ